MRPANDSGSAFEAVSRNLGEGFLPSRIFNDPAIFDLEMERIFGRSWLYVGHVSEVPNPGDYVVRTLAGESFLFVRGKDRQIRVLLNTCRHRGNLVCRTERGNAESFRCAFHGWVYENTGDLLGVPTPKEAYRDRMDRRQWGLIPAPRMDQYNGLVFAALDPEVPALDEHLGDMKWYLDLITKRSSLGLEVVGAPHRWVIKANWKFPADNFTGDSFHLGGVHDSLIDIGVIPRRGVSEDWYATAGNISLNNGHCVFFSGAGPGVSLLFLRGYPELLVQSLKGNLLPEQAEFIERAPYMGGNVFPNLGFMDVSYPGEIGGPLTAFLSLRVWQPIAPDRTEICSWFLVESDAPQEFKERSYISYMRHNGPGGTFEKDDAEAWSGATRTAKGVLGRKLLHNLSMGMDGDPFAPGTIPGPFQSLTSAASDANQRAFYGRWLECMSRES